MKTIVLILGLIIPSLGLAGETWISSSLLSYHVKRDSEKNEQNYGVGVKHFVNKRDFIAAGIYKNSNEVDSGYLVGGRCLYRSKHLCAGGVLGAVTGYQRHAIPFGGPVLTVHNKNWGASVLLVPKDGGVLALTLERRFW